VRKSSSPQRVASVSEVRSPLLFSRGGLKSRDNCPEGPDHPVAPQSSGITDIVGLCVNIEHTTENLLVLTFKKIIMRILQRKAKQKVSFCIVYTIR